MYKVSLSRVTRYITRYIDKIIAIVTNKLFNNENSQISELALICNAFFLMPLNGLKSRAPLIFEASQLLKPYYILQSFLEIVLHHH